MFCSSPIRQPAPAFTAITVCTALSAGSRSSAASGTSPATASSCATPGPSARTRRTLATYSGVAWSAKSRPSSAAITDRPQCRVPSKPITSPSSANGPAKAEPSRWFHPSSARWYSARTALSSPEDSSGSRVSFISPWSTKAVEPDSGGGARR